MDMDMDMDIDGYGYGWILCITGYHIDAGWDGKGMGWDGIEKRR
jgi:hypothetical protein